MRSHRFGWCVALSLVVVPGSLSAADDPVQASIKKAVAYLEQVHRPAANYAGGSHTQGSATLAGLALLEAGVPANHPSVQNIIAYVRRHALKQTATYELSLTIMFLDRVGSSADRPVIQMLGFRLLGGQASNGGWSYDCGYGYGLSDDEEAKLTALLNKEARLVGVPRKDALKPPTSKSEPRPDLPFDETFPPVGKNVPTEKKEAPKPVEDKPILHPEVARWARLVNLIDERNEPKRGDNKNAGGDGDNSNTQFATLGLWCARKHGLPCNKAFEELDLRYRTSQSDEGGWGYHYQYGGRGNSTAAMTCAGLVALATTHGAQQAVLRNNPNLQINNGGMKKGAVDIENDNAIKKGLKALGNFITAAKGLPPEGKMEPRKGKGRFKVDDLNSNLYFLWSLERVAMIYGLDTIGNHDWYAWGADALIDTQRADGSWQGRNYHGANEELNTSFALLFLSRANVVRDLSAALQGKVQDPGVAVLRGGSDLLQKKPDPVPANRAPLPGPVAAVTSPIKNDPPKVGQTPMARNDEFSAEAVALSDAVLKAPAAEQPALLRQLRDNKGSVNTEALARAASKAKGALQAEARDALARRLTRMTAATLRDLVKDADREIRHAAILACGYKNEKQFIPLLLSELDDTDAGIVQASRTGLRLLSGKDFGPEFAAKPAEKVKAIQDWKSWWQTQSN